MNNTDDLKLVNTYHQVSLGCKERYELWYKESQSTFILREYLDNVFSDYFGDITGEAEIMGFSGLFCFDDIQDDIKAYKKSLNTKILTNVALSLAGHKSVLNTSIDIGLILFLKNNKYINISAFVQTAIIEKLERDNKLTGQLTQE